MIRLFRYVQVGYRRRMLDVFANIHRMMKVDDGFTKMKINSQIEIV